MLRKAAISTRQRNKTRATDMHEDRQSEHLGRVRVRGCPQRAMDSHSTLRRALTRDKSPLSLSVLLLLSLFP